MTLPDRFIDHDSQNRQIAEAGLSQTHITQAALAALGVDDRLLKTVTTG